MIPIALAVLGAVGSIVGIWAYVDARRSQRVKALAYERSHSVPLATARGHETDYKLSIHYTEPGGREEVIKGAFVTYLAFANFGREPIRAADIAPSNALRVEIEGTRVLDISLVGSHREVSRISLGRPETGDRRSSATISFDFLDFQDGGLIRVLTTGRTRDIRLAGDIIGMPEGVADSSERVARGPWGKIGFALWLSAEVLAFAALAYVFHAVEGDWDNAWLLLLPFVAFLLPCAGALVVSETIWPSRLRAWRYPDELHPPNWVGGRLGRPTPDGAMFYSDYWEPELDGPELEQRKSRVNPADPRDPL